MESPQKKSQRAVLQFETLEERLVLTASDPISDLAYEEWRSQTFTVGAMMVDTAVVDRESEVGLDQPDPFGDVADFDLQSAQLIGLNQVLQSYAYTGTGYTVAVIDTGIDYTHSSLGGGFGAGYKVVAGYDFVNNDSNPMDDNGHGTHVAGIIASTHASYLGVASGVNLVALKVLDANGSGSFGAVEDALRWVINNRTKYNIVAVNLSLGAGNFTNNPYSFLEDEFSSLVGNGVFIAAASGNSYYTYNSAVGLGYPAISSNTVSVGAVWDANVGSVSWSNGARDYTTAADRITSFTQRSSALDIFAPGATITSTYLNGGFASLAGTSMAAPMVAAASVIIRQALVATGQGHLANQSYILSLMKSTGKTIVDGDDENDNVLNTGLSFKRLDLYAAVQQVVGNANQPPVLAAIANQTMSRSQDKLIIPLSASDPNGDALTFSVSVVTQTPAYQLDQQYGFHATAATVAANFFYNHRGLGEKYFQGNAGGVVKGYFILPNGDVYAQANDFAQSQRIGSLGSSYYTSLNTLLDAQPEPFQGTATIVGGNLILDPAPGATGVFVVTVTVSDGKATAKRTFTVTVANQAPVLAPIANRTMSPAQSQLNVALSASDADGDPITYSVAVAASSMAYQLDQQYGFFATAATVNANYFFNHRGLGERYFQGTTGGVTRGYFILPNGDIFLQDNDFAKSQKIGSVDPSFHANIDTLLNAQPGTFTGTASISGGTLILKPASGYTGTLTVIVTASDGSLSDSKTFTVTVANQAPVLADISDQNMSRSQDKLVLALAASDADGDPLAYSVTVTANSLAYQLDQQYGFYATAGTANANYFFNHRGLGEKYFQGSIGANKGYFILPNGELYAQADVFAQSQKIATLDPSFYSNLNTLLDAQPAAFQGTASIVGNILTIDPDPGYAGVLSVTVRVTDGIASASRSFTVTIANQAPTLASISDKTMPTTQDFISIPLVASDPDGDPLTFGVVAGTASPAFSLDQQYGFYATPGTVSANYFFNHRGLGEKYFQGNAGGVTRGYFILPNGDVFLQHDNFALSQKIASLDSIFHADINRLLDAEATIPFAGTATITGSTLVINPNSGFTGTVIVTVTASDGALADAKTFTLTVTGTGASALQAASLEGLSVRGQEPVAAKATDRVVSNKTPVVEMAGDLVIAVQDLAARQRAESASTGTDSFEITTLDRNTSAKATRDVVLEQMESPADDWTGWLVESTESRSSNAHVEEAMQLDETAIDELLGNGTDLALADLLF